MIKTLHISGFYGHSNCGDDALQLAIQNIFSSVALTNFTENKIASDITPILGAGDVINPFFLEKVSDCKSIKILGAGIGYESEMDLLKKEGWVEEAFFRNYRDVALALKNGIKARYTPDLAFYLDVPSSGYTIYNGSKKKILGVLVADNGSASNTQVDHAQIGYNQYLKATLASVLMELAEWYKIVFIPMSHARYAYDIKMIYEILSFMPPYTITHEIIPPQLSPLEVIHAISQCDMVFSMRFHGIIFSTLTASPFINIGLSRKTALFCDEHDLSQLSLAPYTLTVDRLLKKVKKVEDNFSDIKKRLAEIRDEKKKQLATVTKYLQETWAV
jgi:polysaccharide pyruvyl transferase WcaK-like protein